MLGSSVAEKVNRQLRLDRSVETYAANIVEKLTGHTVTPEALADPGLSSDYNYTLTILQTLVRRVSERYE
jgi:hypothetical protein